MKISQRGFTLVEFIMTLTIVAVLISIGAPAYQDFVQQLRVRNATNMLLNSMNLARIEAIKRNGRVDLIARNNNWKNGWFILSDRHVIFNHEPLHQDIDVASKLTTRTKNYIAYNGTGRTRTDASSYTSQSGSILLAIGEHQRLIVINFLGRVRVCNPTTAKKGTCGGEVE